MQFYLRAIASQPWSDVTIITFSLNPKDLNPTYAALEMMQRSGALGPNVVMHKVWLRGEQLCFLFSTVLFFSGPSFLGCEEQQRVGGAAPCTFGQAYGSSPWADESVFRHIVRRVLPCLRPKREFGLMLKRKQEVGRRSPLDSLPDVCIRFTRRTRKRRANLTCNRQ